MQLQKKWFVSSKYLSHVNMCVELACLIYVFRGSELLLREQLRLPFLSRGKIQ